MPITCTPAALASEAACFTGLTPTQQEAIKTYLLALAAGVSPDPADLVTAAACFTGLTPDQQAAIQIYLLCQANGGTGCGNATSTVLFTAPSGGYDGTYTQVSSTSWEQVAPTDYGFRLVSGVWEVFELISPATVWYTTPEASFPCGTWTQVAAIGPATGAYV